MRKCGINLGKPLIIDGLFVPIHTVSDGPLNLLDYDDCRSSFSFAYEMLSLESTKKVKFVGLFDSEVVHIT